MPDPILTPCTARGNVHDKLGAYLDGELGQRAQSEVRAHLETCAACQAELEELRQLSTLLRAAPQPDFTPALDFKAQLMLQLPRQAETPQTRPTGLLLPWMVPALILTGWIFVQMTFSLSALVSFANQAGVLGDTVAWANSAPQQMQWFTLIQSAFGGAEGQAGLKLLNDVNLFTQNLLLSLLWQVGVAVLYWGAMALVWRKNAGTRLSLPSWGR